MGSTYISGSTQVLQVIPMKKQGAVIGLEPKQTIIRYYYRVQLNQPDPNATFWVSSASGVPQVGDENPDAPGLFCLRQVIDPPSGDFVTYWWTVCCEFGIAPNLDISSPEPEPWLRRTEYTLDWHVYPNEIMHTDYSSWPSSGKPVVNTAGDLFDPPVTTTRKNRVFKFTFARQASSYDVDKQSSLQDTMNSGSYTITNLRGGVSGSNSITINAQSGLLTRVSAVPKTWVPPKSVSTVGTPYWDVEVDIEVQGSDLSGSMVSGSSTLSAQPIQGKLLSHKQVPNTGFNLKSSIDDSLYAGVDTQTIGADTVYTPWRKPRYLSDDGRVSIKIGLTDHVPVVNLQQYPFVSWTGLFGE